MKLLRITSDSENTIDEAIVLVPDNFDKSKLLHDAAENGIENPTIENTIDVGSDDVYGMSEWRWYIG